MKVVSGDPKAQVYGFDTGFVTHVRGWKDVRDDDRGLLWEHLVLDTLRAETGGEGLYHWRDKSGREIDFVVRRGRHPSPSILEMVSSDYAALLAQFSAAIFDLLFGPGLEGLVEF